MVWCKGGNFNIIVSTSLWTTDLMLLTFYYLLKCILNFSRTNSSANNQLQAWPVQPLEYLSHSFKYCQNKTAHSYGVEYTLLFIIIDAWGRSEQKILRRFHTDFWITTLLRTLAQEVVCLKYPLSLKGFLQVMPCFSEIYWGGSFIIRKRMVLQWWCVWKLLFSECRFLKNILCHQEARHLSRDQI